MLLNLDIPPLPFAILHTCFDLLPSPFSICEPSESKQKQYICSFVSRSVHCATFLLCLEVLLCCRERY